MYFKKSIVTFVVTHSLLILPMSSIKSNTTTSKLLIEVAKSIDEFGEQRTHDILFKERTKNVAAKHINFVIKLICNTLTINIDKIIDGKGRANRKRVLAIQLICYYSYEKFKALGVSLSDIANRLKRGDTIVHKHHAKISLDRKDFTKANEYNQKNYKFLDAEVAQYIKSIKPKKIVKDKK